MTSCVNENVDCGKSVYQFWYGTQTPAAKGDAGAELAAPDSAERVRGYVTTGDPRGVQSPFEYARIVHVVTSPKMSMNVIVTATANKSTVVAALKGCPL